jgi:hypothetical protein
VDFCVTKGIPCNFVDAKSCLELSSDHSPVLVTLSAKAILRVVVRHLLNERLLLNVSLKTDSDIEAAIKTLTT